MTEARMFDNTPRQGENIETRYRKITTPLPHPDTLGVLAALKAWEPVSMSGQPPIVWDRAQGFQVYDAAGNCWIDFSSGVLVANCGHNPPELKAALIDQIENGVIFSYCFPNRPRAELVTKLVKLAGGRIERCFLLTTGGEAVENAIKLARTWGKAKGGYSKRVIVSFEGAFHGRTLGAQLAGGIAGLKEWIGMENTGFVTVPFPDEATGTNIHFADFLAALASRNIAEADVCGVITESYQGGTGRFYPQPFMQELRRWADAHDALYIADEVQAGFGRTGRMFTFEHYEVEPDMICCGKGLSGGLPISAVLGNSRFMDLYKPGEMTSTHSGHPLCARAALTSLQLIEEKGLVENSRNMGLLLHEFLRKLRESNSDIISAVNGRGLLAAILFRRPNGEPDGEITMRVVDYCVHHGVMLYAPLGPGGGTVKINPPLVITEEPLREGLQVFADAVQAGRI
jgi:4-aminobutyrate aminotransferase-like enzyme